jgi:ABC-2 type transport system ATP-binding protein
MKILTGFMAPTSGSAKIGGVDVFDDPIAVKKKIGYLPEVPPVYGEMTVEDYLEYVAKLKQVDLRQLPDLVESALLKTDLKSVRSRLIQHLSKGYRQRVGIAQALVSDPEVLILDEPTVGLDPKQVAEIRDLIQSLKGQHTIILSTHILPEVQATCDHIIIIHQGQIVAQDTIENLEKMEKGSSQVQLKVLQKKADMQSVLAGISGVHKIEALTGDQDWRIYVDDQPNILSEVSRAIVQKDLGLIELLPSRSNLEEVFLKLTYGKEAGK